MQSTPPPGVQQSGQSDAIQSQSERSDTVDSDTSSDCGRSTSSSEGQYSPSRDNVEDTQPVHGSSSSATSRPGQDQGDEAPKKCAQGTSCSSSGEPRRQDVILASIPDAYPLLTKARAARREVLRKQHFYTLTSLGSPGLSMYASELVEAETLGWEALEIRSKIFALEPDTLKDLLLWRGKFAILLKALGKRREAEELFRKNLDEWIQLRGDNDLQTLKAKNNLALLYQDQAKLVEAEGQFREVLSSMQNKLTESDPRTLTVMNNLAMVLEAQGKVLQGQGRENDAWDKLKDARQLLEKVVDLSRTSTQLGPGHAQTSTAQSNLALILQDLNELHAATKHCRESLRARQGDPNAKKTDILSSLHNLAELLYRQGTLDEAKELFNKATEMSLDVLGKDHPHTLKLLGNLAHVLKEQGELVKAEASFDEALKIHERVLGAQHPDTMLIRRKLASLLTECGKSDAAVSCLKECLNVSQTKLGACHVERLMAMNQLALLLQKQGELNEAVSLFNKALGGFTQLDPWHPVTLTTMRNLAGSIQEQGHYDESYKLFCMVLTATHELLGPVHPHTLASKNSLARLLVKQAQRKITKARSWFRKALTGTGALLRPLNKKKLMRTFLPKALARTRMVHGRYSGSTLTLEDSVTTLTEGEGALREAEQLVRGDAQRHRRHFRPHQPDHAGFKDHFCAAASRGERP